MSCNALLSLLTSKQVPLLPTLLVYHCLLWLGSTKTMLTYLGFSRTSKVGSGESFVPESDVECPTWLANVMSDDSTMCILLPTHVVRHYQCLLCLGSSKTIFHMQLQHRCWVKVVGGSHILQPWLQPIHLYCNGHSLSHCPDTIDCRLPSHMDLTSEVLI